MALTRRSGSVVLVDFGRRLRQAGIPVGPVFARDLIAVLERVEPTVAEDVYHGFRSMSTTSREQFPVFDRIFRECFGGEGLGDIGFADATLERTWEIEAGDDGGEGDGDDPEDVAAVTGASAVDRLAGRDFGELSLEEAAQVRAMIAGMVWSPSVTVSRRHAPNRRGSRPDLRRTLRGAVGPEGEMLRLATTQRKPRRRPLIVIADVSGSMERYAEMLLYFAHAARGRLGRLEAFVFSTRLTRITRELSRRDPSSAIAEVADSVHDWSGGTRIGESLRAFNVEWSRRVCRGGAIVLIISDGWDRGDPDLLATEIDRLHRSVHRLIWLNPLASRDGFAPETRGMKAALPHVDDFLASGSLHDLRTLVDLLESIPPRR